MTITGVKFNDAILGSFLNLKTAASKATVSEKAVRKLVNKNEFDKKQNELLDGRKKEIYALENTILRNNLMNSISFDSLVSKDIFAQRISAS